MKRFERLRRIAIKNGVEPAGFAWRQYKRTPGAAQRTRRFWLACYSHFLENPRT